MNIPQALEYLLANQNLAADDMRLIMRTIMTGLATPAQIGAFLVALRAKGETVDEVAAAAQVLREMAVKIEVSGGHVIDTCGTGGDGAHTFNISTAASFVAVGAGLTVAKHGNRAMSSICGSADVLEGLGVKIDLDAEGVARCLREAGIGFMFAPKFHPAMRFAGPVRREIGIRTAFNILGPLTNPARARHQVLGVASAALAEKLARALSRLDTIHALVVHGDGGVDELTLSGPNLIYDVRGGQIPTVQTVAPEDIGLARAPQDALRGGDVTTNAAIIRAILSGAETGPRRDVVLLNAAAALVAGDRADNLADGLVMARASIDSGHANERLDRLVAVSNE